MRFLGSKRLLTATLTAVVVGGVSLPIAAAPAAAAPAPALQWGACDPIHGASKETRCATLRVPRDYAHPNGPTISITVSRIPARDQAHKRGVLIGNPGGPGGDAVSMFTVSQVPKAVADEWDLIGVQPRGLPGATPVRCDSITEADDIYFNAGGVDRTRCEKNTPGYTRTLTTETTARDIEMARRALGVERVSLYGISYGTLLMATYATLYPQRTDRLVLDSSVDPNWIWNNILAEQTPGYKARVNAMMAWIAAHDNVYHLGRTPLAVYRKWSAKVTAEAGVPPSLAQPPAQVGDVPPGLRSVAQLYLAGENLTADVRARFANFVATIAKPGALQLSSPLLVLTRVAAPDRNGWPFIARRIAGTVPTPRASTVQLQAAMVSQNMQSLVLCNENQAPSNPADVPASFFANFVVGDIFDGPGLFYRSGMACAGAPSAVRPVALANRGLAIVPLQIQSLGDPQTPYRGSLVMQRIMRSHLITVGGGDHGQLGRDNPALAAALTDYLSTGRTAVRSVGQAAISTPLTGSKTTGARGAGTGVLAPMEPW